MLTERFDEAFRYALRLALENAPAGLLATWPGIPARAVFALR